VPSTTLLEIPPAEQVRMRAILRRTRYGYLLAFHILLLCAAGRTPTEIAAFLFCSRSSVYRIVRAYRAGSLGVRIDPDGQLSIAVQSSILMPIWLTIFDYTINLAVLIMLAPLVVSIIEFFMIRRYTDGELYQRYQRSGERLTLVFVSQFVFLILLVMP
jgi:hypothetical protein